MYATAKTAPPTIEEISATAKGFSKIQFNEKFFADDFIVVTEVSAPSAPPDVKASSEGFRPPPPARADSSTVDDKVVKPVAPVSTKPVSPVAMSAPPAPSAPPPPPPPPANPTVKALYDFVATGDGQMSLIANETYELTNSTGGGDWWFVQSGSISGWAPKSYFQNE